MADSTATDLEKIGTNIYIEKKSRHYAFIVASGLNV